MPILPHTQTLAHCHGMSARPFERRPAPTVWHLHARLALTTAANDQRGASADKASLFLRGLLGVKPRGTGTARGRLTPFTWRARIGGVLGFFFGGRMPYSLKQVHVPEDYCEREALGFRKHTPLKPLVRVEWRGVERRACNRVIPHASQCADQALASSACELGGGDDNHANTGVTA
jgi:hypothetical protein